MAQAEFFGIQLQDEDAWVLARLAVVGFVTLNNLPVLLEQPARREALVASFGILRQGVPFERACCVMQALNAAHPGQSDNPDLQARMMVFMERIMAGGGWRRP